MESLSHDVLIRDIQANWRGRFNDDELQNAVDRGQLLIAIERAQQIIREAQRPTAAEQSEAFINRQFAGRNVGESEVAQKFLVDVIRRDDERRKLSRLADDLKSDG